MPILFSTLLWVGCNVSEADRPVVDNGPTTPDSDFDVGEPEVDMGTEPIDLGTPVDAAEPDAGADDAGEVDMGTVVLPLIPGCSEDRFGGRVCLRPSLSPIPVVAGKPGVSATVGGTELRVVGGVPNRNFEEASAEVGGTRLEVGPVTRD